MQLRLFACYALRQGVGRERMTRVDVDRDRRIAAWLVWSMRGKQDAIDHRKTFNRARRVLQRAGMKRV